MKLITFAMIPLGGDPAGRRDRKDGFFVIYGWRELLLKKRA